MKAFAVKAFLTSLRNIRVVVSSTIPLRDKMEFILYVDDKHYSLTPSFRNGDPLKTIYEFTLDHDFEFGHEVYLGISDLGFATVELNDVINFPNFDELFGYENDDLGAIYSKNQTTFKLWAPIASKVNLIIISDKETKYEMIRKEKGVYEIVLDGDYLNKSYLYEVNNSGIIHRVKDPYGKGVSLNSTYSAVVDNETIRKSKKIVPANEINNYVDSIIYETNIKDFTIDKSTNIVNKGKYLGFVEENKKTKLGHKAGLDYLKELGITHVQLQPVLDFTNVDDVNEDRYNWGYDVVSFFALEGSYSLHPNVPNERLKEFRNLVDTCHKNNIRVVLDVVYNHFYDYLNSCFEHILPGYFFRRQANGIYSNASGCGNDFASEKLMARKIIVSSIKYLLKTFDVDGFRFDLMGLLDVETMLEVSKTVKEIKPDALLYGEGWDMGYELAKENKASINNADKLPEIAFFNDTYRNLLRGRCGYGELTKEAYISGDTSYAQGVEFAVCGSILNIVYDPKFNSANQSVNYIECHDNRTLFDKLSYSLNEENEELLKRIKLGNAILLMSYGIPFIHMGQEIGLSKGGSDNSYNVLNVNTMNWSTVDERYDMVCYIKDLIALRKNGAILKRYSKEDIESSIDFFQEEDIMKITYYIKKGDIHNDPLIVIINPTTNTKQLEFSEDKTILLSEAGLSRNEQLTKHITIGPISVYILR